MGSRDIDLGFHVSKDWSDSELRNSPLAGAIDGLSNAGFVPISFRLVKYFHTETRKELTEEEARTTNLPFVFDLYVDPIVDSIHSRLQEVLGFVPLDEPLLSHAFDGTRSATVEAFGGKFLLPDPAVLLAMKLNSATNRDKAHKRIKDIADIYALFWHSDVRFGDLKEQLLKIVAAEKVSRVVSAITRDEYGEAAQALGLEGAVVSTVIGELKP